MLSEGRPEGIQALRSLDIFDFYTRLTVWQEDTQAKIDRLNANK